MKITRVLSLTMAIVALSAFASTTLNAQQIDVSASTVKWTGYHLAKSYEHYGNIKVKSGEIIMKDGALTAGNIVIDMTSISNTDLEDAKKNQNLVKDLKSERFFYVEEYPEASIRITKVESSGSSQYNVAAEIQIRGIKQNIEFTLNRSTADGKTVLSGKLEVDRIKHEVNYGWTIENAMLSNTFDLDVHIVLSEQQN